MRKDGSRFWASVVIAALRDERGALIGFGKVSRDLTERKRNEESLRSEVAERRRMGERLRELNDSLEGLVAERTAELRASNAELVDARRRLQHLSGRLITAQEEERHRIARELHDETGQALTTLRMRLAMALASEEQRVAQLEECGLVVDEAVKQVRNMAQDLRPLVLDDLGLVDALEWLLARQAKLAGWNIQLTAEPMQERPVPAVETACFRIAQEALTNIARHAAARNVEVELRRDDEVLELSVVDDGKGFDAQEVRSRDVRERHFGLVSMTERAGLVGGRVDIHSAPGRGTRIHVTFPGESPHEQDEMHAH